MKIANFEVDGFGVWSDLHVERFSDGLNLIHGPNEAGKTTLLQFLRSMLYGFSPRRRQYLPPLHEGRPGGALEVSGPNGRFRVERRLLDDDTSADEQLTLTAADGTRQGEHFLKVLLSNVDEAVFNNVFAVGLREIQELSTLGATDAAAMLYNLSVGLDRVSLVDVFEELENSRNRLLDAAGRPCQVLELLAEREKLLSEIDEFSAINHRYGRLAAERANVDAEITRLEEETNRAQRRVETMDLAAAVADRWRRRKELDEQLVAIKSSATMPPDAIERLDALGGRIERRRRQIDRLAQKRDRLRREFAAVKINENLRRQSARIEAMREQEPWIARLRTEIDDSAAEIAALESELTAEAARLGFSNLPDPLPVPSAGELRSVRGPARAVRERRGRLTEAKRAAAAADEQAESLDRQLQTSLAALGHDAPTAAQVRATENAELLRRRQELDGRIEDLARYRGELEDRGRRLVDRRLLPAGALYALGAAFVLGVVLLLTGLFMPESVVGAAGWTLAVLGLAGSGTAALGKVLLERSNVHRLDACRKQLELVRTQITEAEADRERLDARLPGQGPISSRLREARRELAALEELNPLQQRLQSARQDARAASRRAAEARAEATEAARRWRAALASVGLPETISPKHLRRLAGEGDRIAERQRRLNRLREELARRRQEMESLAGRVAQIAADAGVASSSITREEGADASDPIELLRRLSEAAAAERAAVARREAVRRRGRRIRAAVTECKDSLARLNHRRRRLFITAGVKDEQEYRRRALEQARADELRRRRDEICREIEAVIAGRCPEEAVGRQLEEADPSGLEDRRAELARRLANLGEKLGELLERRGRLSEQVESLAGDRQLASKQLDLAVLEERLRRAVARWQTLAVACRVLEAIRESYERDRQPETLRGASAYLERFTQGRYVRVWTPLGENSLRIDDAQGRTLSVEALSRGTREQLFLSLRLALASSYARRGAELPMVLDDVLVNFDADRARAAAAVLRDFAAEGRQLLVFTCHEHILKLFKSLKAPVARLPDSSEPGGVVSLDTSKAEEKPERAKRSASPRRGASSKNRKSKPAPRKAADIEVVEDDAEEPLEDDSSWADDETDDEACDDEDLDAAA